MSRPEGRGGDGGMLHELRIRGFVVIDELSLELGPGLTVLSGETGAGKSILVEALSLLLGERASTDLIRAGEDRAVLEARFDVQGLPAIRRLLEEGGADAEERWLILRRELRREGSNRVWVNGSPSTARLLGDLGDALVELHGQHEHQRLLRRPEQRSILDAYAGATDLAERVAEAHAGLVALDERLADTRRRQAGGRERADFLRFKADEIEAAGLEPDEEERIESERRRLSHSEELLELSGRLYAEIYEEEGAILERLGGLRRPLAELVRIDPEAGELGELHEAALANLEELGRRLGEYRDGVEHDPARLEELRVRLDRLYRLKRKYGETVREVIESGAAARRELAEIEGFDDEIAGLEREREERRRGLGALARELTSARERAAAELVASVETTLPELGLDGGRFRVHLEALDEIGPGGRERVEFRVALNPGFEPGPLSRVASGGEMSRLMLALKTALVEVDDVPVLVFDEVDAGIGGEVAHRVARRLAEVASAHQVLVVTHLAQIAARADAHLSVDKSADEARAHARVRRLDGAERVRELARMLGGDPESAASRTHAEELLAGRS